MVLSNKSQALKCHYIVGGVKHRPPDWAVIMPKHVERRSNIEAVAVRQEHELRSNFRNGACVRMSDSANSSPDLTVERDIIRFIASN